MNRDERERVGSSKRLKRQVRLAKAIERAGIAFDWFTAQFRMITTGCTSMDNAVNSGCDCAYVGGHLGRIINDCEHYADKALAEVRDQGLL